MSYSQYGAVGGFDTTYSQGGFLSPTQTGTNFGGEAGQSAAKKRDPQSVLPVTIKQLNEAEIRDGNKFRIDGREVAQVTFIGCIISYEIKSTNCSYHLTDSTGEVHVKLYIDNEGGDELRALLRKTKGIELHENMYVRVIGNPRLLSEQRNVIAFQIVPLTDYNEITMHNLDVIYCHLKNTRGDDFSNQAAAASINQQQVNLNPQVKNEYAIPTQGMLTNDSYALQQQYDVGAMNVGPYSNSDFTPLQREILQHFAADNSDSGASIQSIVQKLGSRVSAVEIRQQVEWLSDEGHLYSTIDEDHFKNTVMP